MRICDVSSDVCSSDLLLAQVGERFSGMEAMVAEQIVALIDEAGYLRADLSELAQRLGVPLGLVEAGLAGVQDFDPSGVGGRDLAECIAIQAREAECFATPMAGIARKTGAEGKE